MDPYLDHFLGAILGTFVGDALGEPVEGWPKEAIAAQFGILDRMVGDTGHYTDDTQMMIGILETLMEKGHFDPTVCARRFERNFDPRRGYGRRISGVMDRIRQGIPWDHVGTDSFGNGGAMRIAPIGCFYYHDVAGLKEKAIQSARITHTHPEGVAGAVAQAVAVGFALTKGLSGEPFDRNPFVKKVADQVTDIDTGFQDALLGIRDIDGLSVPRVIDAIARRFTLSLKAIESVPASLAAFLCTSDFRDAVVVAVNLGGDTDTIGAMAGAIAGAYYGYQKIPQAWLDGLENGKKGKDYVIGCVKALVSHLQGNGSYGDGC